MPLYWRNRPPAIETDDLSDLGDEAISKRKSAVSGRWREVLVLCCIVAAAINALRQQHPSVPVRQGAGNGHSSSRIDTPLLDSGISLHLDLSRSEDTNQEVLLGRNSVYVSFRVPVRIPLSGSGSLVMLY